MRKLPTCFPRHFTFLPQCLMVLFFYMSASIRCFVLILTILLCVSCGLVCELTRPFFFPQAHILTQSVTVLWWYAESTNIPTWAQSPSPLFSVGTFLNLYNPLKFLCPNLFDVHFLPLLILLPSSHWRCCKSSTHNECKATSISVD